MCEQTVDVSTATCYHRLQHCYTTVVTVHDSAYHLHSLNFLSVVKKRIFVVLYILTAEELRFSLNKQIFYDNRRSFNARGLE